jgi:hypothetical protein
MARLHHFDVTASNRMAITRDDQTGERTRPVLLDGPRHGRRGFPCADHDGAPARRRRQMRWYDARRIGRVQRGTEE